MKSANQRIVLIFLMAWGLVAVAAGQKTRDDYQDARDGINRFGAVYRELTSEYVDEIDHDLILRAGIDGMLAKLDPYTVFMDKTEASDLDIMSSGKYGGIGVELGVRGNNRELTVMSVFDAYPASRSGVRVGDVLLEVDTFKTNGWTTTKASTHLRGDPGTPVVVTVKRSGTKESVLRFEMNRAAIEVQDIGYSGMINDSTGYIKLLRFGRNASRDLSRALDSLLTRGMKECVLDLRQNPGGLLNVAIDVSQQFLGSNALIVSTRGRDSTDLQEYRANLPAHFTGGLAVLVDEGSASASEIVAGALQDQDLAVIVGSSTYGKGLVQSVRRLPGDASLKLTTAKYYTPSGRLIQKVDYFHGADSLAEAGKSFKSKNGRKLPALGGISPDVDISNPKPTAFITELLRSGYLATFVNDTLSDSITVRFNKKIKVSDGLLEHFKSYLLAKGFTAPLDIDAEWIAVKAWLTTKDKNSETTPMSDGINRVIDAERSKVWQENKSELTRLVAMETAAWYDGNKGRYRSSMERDPVVAKAVDILKQPKRVQELLAETNPNTK